MISFYRAGVPYTISFRAGEGKYSIYLNRVWFWQLSRKNRQEPLLIPQATEAGISVEVKSLRLLNDILY
jgi:hypothetical protein